MLLKRFILLCSFFMYSSQTLIRMPFNLTPFNNKNVNNSKMGIKTLPYCVIQRNTTEQRRMTAEDFKTLMQIWLTLFIFTFPIIIFPNKDE